MKSWLQDNKIQMCSTQNEGKSVVGDLLEPLKIIFTSI